MGQYFRTRDCCEVVVALLTLMFVLQQRNVKVLDRNEFITQVDSDIRERLALVHQQFHKFFDVTCLSHPFCDLCKHVC